MIGHPKQLLSRYGNLPDIVRKPAKPKTTTKPLTTAELNTRAFVFTEKKKKKIMTLGRTRNPNTQIQNNNYHLPSLKQISTIRLPRRKAASETTLNLPKATDHDTPLPNTITAIVTEPAINDERGRSSSSNSSNFSSNSFTSTESVLSDYDDQLIEDHQDNSINDILTTRFPPISGYKNNLVGSFQQMLTSRYNFSYFSSPIKR